MKSFLNKVVSTHLANNNDLSNHVFILPNQRAGVHLKEILKKRLTKPGFFPKIITFDNLAEQIVSTVKTSAVELLFDFYTIYLKLTPANEADSFTNFSGWASLILNDFNEIDANLVDQKAIFSSLKDINQLHNWSFETEMTKNYLLFFQKLELYYTKFYAFLIKNKKGYQGMILREAVKELAEFTTKSSNFYIFAGFNYLKKSEEKIIQYLLAAQKAAVYWDISENLLKDKHAAGYFIRKYYAKWDFYKTHDLNWVSPDKFKTDNLTITGVPKNVGMLKYAGTLLAKEENTKNSTIVLPDQSLLTVALNSIPKQTGSINITMGYPLKNTPFSDLSLQLFQLHLQQKKASKDVGYYYQNLLKVLQHPIVLKNFDGVSSLIKQLTASNSIYITYQALFAQKELFTEPDFKVLMLLLKPLDTANSFVLLVNINKLIKHIKSKVSDSEKEILYRHYQLHLQLQKLHTKYLYVNDLKSLYHLYKKLLFSESITFLGKADQGLQIMGFLETQALDFKQVILTSVNEGILPAGKSDKSFIPLDVRLFFELPTYKEQDAITAYHFYRLLQRAETITLLYNTEADVFGGAEKSRFITQLLWEHPNIKQQLIAPNIISESVVEEKIHKTDRIISSLNNMASSGFSPSSLASYLYNPLDFYYRKILKVNELKKLEEIVADNTMGSILHNTLERLYQPYINQVLSADALTTLLPKIPKVVQFFFKEIYYNGSIQEGKNKLIYEVVVNFVKRFIKSEIKAIKSGQVIKIIALEKSLSYTFNFPKFDFPIKIKGIVDRIDLVNGVLRIVDYKSGKVLTSQLKLNHFDKIHSDYKYAKGLQVMLYAYMYVQSEGFDFSTPLQAGIISFKNLKEGFLAVNFASGRKKDYEITQEYFELFLVSLQDLLLEIYDPKKPFIAIER